MANGCVPVSLSVRLNNWLNFLSNKSVPKKKRKEKSMSFDKIVELLNKDSCFNSYD